MALIRCNLPIVQISGRLDGVIFRGQAGRTIAQARPSQPRPSTPAALDARNRLAFAAATWTAMLPAVRQSWSTAAGGLNPPHGAVGGTNWTGRQIYTMICTALDWLTPPSLLWCPYRTGLLPLASLSLAATPFSVVATVAVYAAQPASLMVLEAYRSGRLASRGHPAWFRVGTFIATAPWLPDYELAGQLIARKGFPQSGELIGIRARLISPGYFPSPWSSAEASVV